ncbi:MAG: transposase [Chloroflexota bacterium]
MPPRNMTFCSGCYYHLYNRGVNKERIFFERENYLFFLRRAREYFGSAVSIVAYCLMPTHYHLLINLASDNLAPIMSSLGMSYARAINVRFERTGPLFQGRFCAKLVDKDEYLLHLSRYIHLNPVVAKLVQKAEDWEYSSYREYLGLRHGTLPNPDVVLAHFKTPGDSQSPGVSGADASYRAFVESYQESTAIQHLLFDD